MTKRTDIDLYQQSGSSTSITSTPEDAWRQNLRGDTTLSGPRLDSWWTGKKPIYGECPGVNIDGIIRPLALPHLNRCTRKEVLDYFDNTWTLTEVLFSSLQSEEAFYRAPIHHLRHPLIFYYAHPAVFYINKLRLAGILNAGINPYFEQYFEIGVDEMSWDDLSKNLSAFPSVEELTDYRAKAYKIIRNVIESHAGFAHLPINQHSPLWALFMAFEHEHIHLETSSVLIRELPIDLVAKPDAWPNYFPLSHATNSRPRKQQYPESKFIHLNVGTAHIGKPEQWPSYGWDNEYGKRDIVVKPFEATAYLISNAEYWLFVAAGGYQQEKYWSEEGWKWRSFRHAKHPTFWVPDGPSGSNQFKLRLCFDIVPMQWAWPVNVNYHEAKAYCHWRSIQDKTATPYRIATEAEHHRMRTALADDPIMLLSGHEMQAAKFNLSLAYGSEAPVNFTTPSKDGFYDVFGNVWEWCEDHFAALPGFKIHDLYDDFSTPCFDGQHNIIMGGSFISAGDLASKFARYHFRRHFFQHASFRLVKPLQEENHLQTTCLDAPPPHIGSMPCCTINESAELVNKYDEKALLNQYLLLHYGNAEVTHELEPFPANSTGFPQKCAQWLLETAKMNGITLNRALDLGCAVGGASFELAREIKEVIGIDLSSNFIQAANSLKTDGVITFARSDEGEIKTKLKIMLDKKIDRQHVYFQIADATMLPNHFSQFDAVLVANLLCRLPSPKACLTRMFGAHGLVKVGGLLLITSPYSWLEQFTPKSAWLGGKILNNTAIQSIDGLHATLDGHFKLIAEKNIPLVIREHARKYEYIITHGTMWQRIR